MKEGIHPNYKQTTIKCACGAVIETGSTKQNITVEICSKCHPFYTGTKNTVSSNCVIHMTRSASKDADLSFFNVFFRLLIYK